MSENVESDALEMGWVPQEKFRGDPEKWVDASTFVERGKTIMPLLKKTNQNLETKLDRLRQDLTALMSSDKEKQATIDNLIKFQKDEVKRQVEARLSDLKAMRSAARKEGDHALADDLTDQIEEVKEKAPTFRSEGPPNTLGPPNTPAQPSPEPWAVAFVKENEDWLGKDHVRSGVFRGYADELLAEGNLRGRALLDEAKKRTEAFLAPKPRADKAEGGSRGEGGGAASEGKGFDALPADAKAACRAQEKQFVGPGKAFKDAAGWRKHFADTYFAT